MAGTGSRIRRLFRLGGVERELDAELAFHFDRTVVELVANGLTRQAAVAEARRRFGDSGRYRRELARLDRGIETRRRLAAWLAAAAEGGRDSLRAMRRAPGLTLVVALTFGLGIGANATMFGIIDRLLLSPPPHVTEPDRVRRLLVDQYVSFMGARYTGSTLTLPGFEDFTRVSAFESVAAFFTRRLVIGHGGEAVQIPAALVSGEYFELLGVRPALGRLIGARDDSAGAEGVAVLGHEYWRRVYGADPSVLGRTVDFGHGPYAVIGVAPKGLTDLDLGAVDLWLPLRQAGARLLGEDALSSRQRWWVRVVARLAPSATLAAAEAEATAVHRQAHAEKIAGDGYDPEVRVVAAPLIAARGPTASDEPAVALWLGAVSLAVLLIACANVANLLLARGVQKRRETGVRLALGIPRGRLVSQALLDSLLLAAVGAVAALLVAGLGGGALRAALLPQVEWGASALTARTSLFLLGAALAAGLAAGILPALQAGRREVMEPLRVASGDLSNRRSRARTALAVAQVALSVMLLAGAGLFVRSLGRVQAQDLGFDARRLLVATPTFPDGAGTAADRATWYARALDRLGTMPAVAAAAASKGMPFGSSYAPALRVPGIDELPRLPTGGPYAHAVSRDYFETLGLRIVRGRGFDRHDLEGAPRVAVVNETMARLLWPAGEALGRCLLVGPEASCSEVVGVVQDARRQRLVEGATAQFYLPLEQGVVPEPPDVLLIRAAIPPLELLAAVRDELLALEPAIRFASVRELRELIDPQARSWRLGATMFSVFGALALVVAAIGLYSLLAFDVACRTREIGVRSALGASGDRLVGMVLGQSLRVASAGVALGVGAALLLSPRLEPLLFETSPQEPSIFLAVALALLLVAAGASGLPAWRASRVDPSRALGSD